jgi:hypothetical protein
MVSNLLTILFFPNTSFYTSIDSSNIKELIILSTNNKTYCFDLAVSAIYKGAPKNLLGSKESASASIDGWSPNNIRRLVISADGILVQRYVTTNKCPKLIDIVLFKDMAKFQDCIDEDDYKPISKALSYLRICSNVEEIIYLTAPGVSGVRLPLEETRVTEYHQSLKRLHSRVMLRMSLKDFAEATKTKLCNPLYQVCEDDSLQNKKVEIKVEDWYSHYPLRPHYYTLDNENGKLAKYFNKVEQDVLSNIKRSKLEKLNNSRYGAQIEEFKKLEGTLSKMLNCVAKLCMLQSENNRGTEHLGKFALENSLYREVVYASKVGVPTEVLADYKEYSKATKSFMKAIGVVLSEKPASISTSTETLESTNKLLNYLISATYSAVLQFTLELIKHSYASYPTNTKVLLSYTEHSIKDTSQVSPLRDELVAEGVITKSSITAMGSFYNCMHMLSMFLLSADIKFIYRSGITDVKYTKQYWSGVGDK